MNLLRIILYEVIYYGAVAWLAFIAITFCASRYAGWIGALVSPLVIAGIIVYLDVQWIWDSMQHHPEAGRDADMVFFFGMVCRVLLFNGLLIPVSWFGLRRRRIAREQKDA